MTTEFKLHELLQRDGIVLSDLPLSQLLVMNDSQYPWFVLVPRVEGVQDVYQMDWQQQQQFLNESSLLSELLMQLFNGDKMNVAALGNVCPQLHIHHIVRFKTDKAWPKPIWGESPMVNYTEQELDELKHRLQPALNTVLAQL